MNGFEFVRDHVNVLLVSFFPEISIGTFRVWNLHFFTFHFSRNCREPHLKLFKLKLLNRVLNKIKHCCSCFRNYICSKRCVLRRQCWNTNRNIEGCCTPNIRKARFNVLSEGPPSKRSLWRGALAWIFFYILVVICSVLHHWNLSVEFGTCIVFSFKQSVMAKSGIALLRAALKYFYPRPWQTLILCNRPRCPSTSDSPGASGSRTWTCQGLKNIFHR